LLWREGARPLLISPLPFVGEGLASRNLGSTSRSRGSWCEGQIGGVDNRQ